MGFLRQEAPNDSGVIKILDAQTFPSKFLTPKPTLLKTDLGHPVS